LSPANGDSRGPLGHISVLDLTVNVPGPFCSTILGDLGARVIKVEPPGGDPLRHSPGIWASINHGKKSIALDLKTDGGRQVLRRLAQRTDIVLEGWRPGVAERLGTDYSTLSDDNAGLVYCSISGFGQDGPWRERPGHDVNYLALSGYMGLQSEVEGRPWPPAVLFSDLVSGLYAAIMTLAAIAGRSVSGEGAYIDLSMTDVALALMGLEVGRAGDPSEDGRSPNVTFIPHYGLFPCADGRWLSLGIVHEDHFWDRFCEVAGLDDMTGMDLDERLREADSIQAALAEVFPTRAAADWEQALLDADVPAAAVADLAEVLDTPHFMARGMFASVGGDTFLGQPARFSTGRTGPSGTPPGLGEQTDDILAWLGCAPGEVEDLRAMGVFGAMEHTGA
jgi:crotonobetainyl-CoA:carnitine CoA-transferase CaiB-like acyl-CoA transferase